MSGPSADRDELDRRIREAFSNAGSPAAPDTLRASLERLPAAAIRRPPARRPLGLSGAVVIAVALVLVGAVVANRLQAPAASPPPPTGAPIASPSASAEASPSGPLASAVAVVPWAAATPPPQPGLPTPKPVPPGTRPCTAADLAATADWQGATGSMAGGIVATNVGPTACVLDGSPGDVVIHAGATTMRTTYTGDARPRPGRRDPVRSGAPGAGRTRGLVAVVDELVRAGPPPDERDRHDPGRGRQPRRGPGSVVAEPRPRRHASLRRP